MTKHNICKINGCVKPIKFKSRNICQMHYFRYMRNGTYDLKQIAPVERIVTPNGYITVYAPHLNGIISTRSRCFEHRKVIFDKYGYDLPPCEICGEETNWDTCHIDHKNNNKKDNRIENLRPICRPCNTARGRQPEHTYKQSIPLAINGSIMTAAELARMPNVNISASTILRRKRKGMADIDAVYGEKKTHKG